MKAKKENNEQENFIEGWDYYLNAEGKMVLTEKYLLKKGSCCGSGCLHCPYPIKKNTGFEFSADDLKADE